MLYRPELLHYTCDCLSESYSARYCQIISKKIQILKIVWIYQYIRRHKSNKKRKTPVIQRFIYVNAPSLSFSVDHNLNNNGTVI
jgi:hypothetical protein